MSSPLDSFSSLRKDDEKMDPYRKWILSKTYSSFERKRERKIEKKEKKKFLLHCMLLQTLSVA